MVEIEPLSELLIDKYRRFEPGFYEIDPHVSDQWSDIPTTFNQTGFDTLTGIPWSAITYNLYSRVKHIRMDRNPREKFSRVFGSKLPFPNTLIDTGSTSVGAGIKDPNIADSSDIDRMFTITKLPGNLMDKVVEFLPDSPGYAWLNFTGDDISDYKKKIPHKEGLFICYKGKEYLSAPGAKKWKALDGFFDKQFTKEESNEEQSVSPAVRFSLDVTASPDYFKEDDFQNSIYNTLKKKYTEKFKIDMVPCVAFITCFPGIANDWAERTYKRFGKNVLVEVLQNGFHLVPKTRPENGDFEKDWRISFSIAEGILIDKWTEKQFLCLVCLKIFMKCLGELPDIGMSYILKTVMLWSIEEKEFSCWSGPLGCCVVGVLDIIYYCLANGHLEHYFISGLNVLQGKSMQDITQVLNCLKNHRNNPLDFLPEMKSQKQYVSRSDIKWFFAYDPGNNELEKLSFCESDLEILNKNWSKYLINLAVLTIEDFKLNHCSKNAMKVTEILLKAWAAVVQEVFVQTKLDIDQCPLNPEGKSLIDLQAEQLTAAYKTEFKEYDSTLTAADRTKLIYNEARFLASFQQLNIFLQELLPSVTSKVLEDEDYVMNVYIDKLLANDVFKDVQVDLSSEWFQNLYKMSLEDIAKTTCTLFKY